MLAVFLLILKIIGIVLLAILGMLLLLLLILLFVPVRYKITVKRTGIDGDPPAVVRTKVTWLLHILNVHAEYPADIYLKVRIFFITLIKMPDRKREQKKGRREKKKKEAAADEDGGTNIQADNEQADPEQADPQAAANTEQPSTEDGPAAENTEDASETAEIPPKKNILYTIRAFYDKIKGIIRQIRDKIIHIEDTLASVKSNIDHYRSIMESQAFSESLHLAGGQLFKVLKSIGPKKCRIYIEEGMEDPATTASVLAIYGVFYPWLFDKVTVVGNFDEQILKADVFIKGRITFARILYAAIKIYFNKQVRTLIRMMKKEDKS